MCANALDSATGAVCVQTSRSNAAKWLSGLARETHEALLLPTKVATSWELSHVPESPTHLLARTRSQPYGSRIASQ
jgi:hypothetical protein